MAIQETGPDVIVLTEYKLPPRGVGVVAIGSSLPSWLCDPITQLDQDSLNKTAFAER